MGYSNCNVETWHCSDDLLSGDSNNLPKKTDEQSALSHIVRETAM